MTHSHTVVMNVNNIRTWPSILPVFESSV